MPPREPPRPPPVKGWAGPGTPAPASEAPGTLRPTTAPLRTKSAARGACLREVHVALPQGLPRGTDGADRAARRRLVVRVFRQGAGSEPGFGPPERHPSPAEVALVHPPLGEVEDFHRRAVILFRTAAAVVARAALVLAPDPVAPPELLAGVAIRVRFQIAERGIAGPARPAVRAAIRAAVVRLPKLRLRGGRLRRDGARTERGGGEGDQAFRDVPHGASPVSSVRCLARRADTGRDRAPFVPSALSGRHWWLPDLTSPEARRP